MNVHHPHAFESLAQITLDSRIDCSRSDFLSATNVIISTTPKTMLKHMQQEFTPMVST